MGAWISWGISTLLLLFLNRKKDNKNEEETNSQQPSKFTESNVNNIGNPVPVVLGRALIKNPMISFYGAFRADPYTEEYGMHTDLDIKSILIAKLITGLISCFIPTTHTVVTSGGSGVANDTSNGVRNKLIALAIELALLWIFSKLFNDNKGRTTIQKGFKYYLGWQHIICWTGDNIGIKKIWMNVYDSEVESSTEIGVWDNDSHVAWEADNMNGIVAHIENEEMFGGVDEGGGFIGDIRIYFGNDTQPKDQWMISQMSKTENVPADLLGLTPKYPMYLTCVVSDSDRENGAYIGKQATVPEMWFEVVNFPDALKIKHNSDIEDEYIRRLEYEFSRATYLISTMPPDVQNFMQPYMDNIRNAYFAWRGGTGSRGDITNALKNARAVYNGDNLADFLYITDYLLFLLEHDVWNIIHVEEDANPASVIYEILTNKMWGCGYEEERIDIDSLIKVAIKCEEEQIGISCLINRVSQANEYIMKILRHINGVKFDNPFTGKLTFRLIRADYDIDKIKTFNTSNCESCEFSRLDWSETTSAVSVTYTDASNKYDNSQYLETDVANRYITKNYTETSVDGEYFTTMENAKWLGQMSLMSAGYPLSAVSLVTNRYAYDLMIGDPIKVFWEPYGITQMVFRVTDIDYSDLHDGRIKITAIEDVFGFDKIQYHYSEPPQWIDPEHVPEDVLYHRYEESPFELEMSLDTRLYLFAAQPADDTVYLNVWRYV